VGIPLLSDGELIGALYIGAERPDLFERRSIDIAREITNPIAIAIRQNRLHEAVQRRTEALEQEVQKRTAELQQREQLAATGRMAARIAHEINNPLAGIKNAFRLLKDAVPADHPHAHYGSRIDKEIDRIAGILQPMFDLYRPEQEVSRTFRLDETINDVITLLEPSCRQYGVQMTTELLQLARVVHLPEGAVRQILFNLLVNAIEASPSGGVVEVKGIPQELHQQVFEPFFTTKEGTSRRGLGLGLSISKNLVEALNGRIEFRSRANQGMIFQVILPHHMPTGKERVNG
jgi:signal transduction histidine kinase